MKITEIEKITTVQACATLLAGAEKKKRSLERKRRNLGESIGAFRKRMDALHQESARVQSSIDTLKIACQALPEGKEKMTLHIMIKRLEVRQALLEKRAYTYNVAALLVKELSYNQLDSQVSVWEEHVTAIRRWMNVLAPVPALDRRADVTDWIPYSSGGIQQEHFHPPVEVKEVGIGDAVDVLTVTAPFGGYSVRGQLELVN